jgi:hypothetical protein
MQTEGKNTMSISRNQVLYSLDAHNIFPIAVNVTTAPKEQLVSCEFTNIADAQKFVQWASTLGLGFNFHEALKEAIATDHRPSMDDNHNKITIMFDEPVYAKVAANNRVINRSASLPISTPAQIQAHADRLAAQNCQQEFTAGFDIPCTREIFESVNGVEFHVEKLEEGTGYTQCRFENFEDAKAFFDWVNTLNIRSTLFEITMDETYRKYSTYVGKSVFTIRFLSEELHRVRLSKSASEQNTTLSLSPQRIGYAASIGSSPGSAFTKRSPEKTVAAGSSSLVTPHSDFDDEEEKSMRPSEMSLNQLSASNAHTFSASASASHSSGSYFHRATRVRSNLAEKFEKQEQEQEEADLALAIQYSLQQPNAGQDKSTFPSSSAISLSQNTNGILPPAPPLSPEAQSNFLAQTAEGKEQEDEDLLQAIRQARCLSEGSLSLTAPTPDASSQSGTTGYEALPDFTLMTQFNAHIATLQALSAEAIARSFKHPVPAVYFAHYLEGIDNEAIKMVLMGQFFAEQVKKSATYFPPAGLLASSMSNVIGATNNKATAPTDKVDGQHLVTPK